ncbi:MAG: DUF2953 domain-containing protein [Oscillospiraceae bacterium]|nr:DUF2953 domain-containing protein [Oscillospiraceae bacterium]
MGWTIFLSIVFVLCILFLLPIRVKAEFGGGKWSVKVYYAFIRVFRKESAPPPPPPETPPKPEDITLFEPGTDPNAPDIPPPEPAAQTEPPASVTEPASDAEPKPEPEPEQEKPKDQRKKKRRKHLFSKEDAAPAEEEKPGAEQPAADADEQAEEDGTKKKKKEKKKKKPGFFKRIKPHSFSDVIGLIKDGFAALTPALRFLFRHFHFRHVKVRAAIASDDPANTATLYGKICAAAFNLLAQLQRLFDFQTDEFRVLADFYGEKSDYSGALELRVSPAVLILTVLILGIKFLWRTFRRFRREDKEEKRREKESAPLPQKA